MRSQFLEQAWFRAVRKIHFGQHFLSSNVIGAIYVLCTGKFYLSNCLLKFLLPLELCCKFSAAKIFCFGLLQCTMLGLFQARKIYFQILIIFQKQKCYSSAKLIFSNFFVSLFKIVMFDKIVFIKIKNTSYTILQKCFLDHFGTEKIVFTNWTCRAGRLRLFNVDGWLPI